jgi:hypothetical protein
LGRYCRFRDIAAIPEDEAAAVIAPPPLNSGEGSVWKDSVDLAEELGAVSRSSGELKLLGPVWEDIGHGDVSSARRGLRRLVLAAEHNEGLWSKSKGAWSADGAREFSRIAVWFLQVPIEETGPGGESPYTVARNMVEGPTDALLVENDEQWRVFERWGSALGLVASFDEVALADPTAAVADEITDVFSGSERLPSREVRDKILNAIPVLQGGRDAEGLDRWLRDRPSREAAHAGVGLSVALLRLKAAGVLRFEQRSDGDRLILSYAEESPTDIVLTRE